MTRGCIKTIFKTQKQDPVRFVPDPVFIIYGLFFISFRYSPFQQKFKVLICHFAHIGVV